MKHRRADRVHIIGEGPRAQVIRHAGCSCGAQSEHPMGAVAREIWWRDHKEGLR